ncbi:MAG: hypothetical protein JWP97_6497 [Labilithrix sp.]|nr:hypothetical protein [Labilithrix sp.]
MLGLASGVALAAACSSFGADGEDPGGIADAAPPLVVDAFAPDVVEVDGAVDASTPPPCSPGGAFGAPQLVPSLNAAPYHTLSARPAGDFLYFVSNRHLLDVTEFSNVDVYRARFAGEAFADIQRLVTVSAPDKEDVAPTETVDGLTLYLGVGDITVRRIVRSTRASRLVDYPMPSVIGSGVLVNGADAESDPYIVGNTLYFMSASGTTSAIYALDLSFSKPPLRVAGATGKTLRFPVVDAEQNELFYVEYPTTGPPVLYSAHRSTVSGTFVDPKVVVGAQFPGSNNVNVTALSADGCDLYLAARFDAGFNVYRARRGQ